MLVVSVFLSTAPLSLSSPPSFSLSLSRLLVESCCVLMAEVPEASLRGVFEGVCSCLVRLQVHTGARLLPIEFFGAQAWVKGDVRLCLERVCSPAYPGG